MKKQLLITVITLLSFTFCFAQTRNYDQTIDGREVRISCTESERDFLWTIDEESFRLSKDTSSFHRIEFATGETSFLLCMANAQNACSQDWMCDVACFHWMNPFCIVGAITVCKKNPNHNFYTIRKYIESKANEKTKP